MPLVRDTPGAVPRASPLHSHNEAGGYGTASWHHRRAQRHPIVVAMTAVRALLVPANARIRPTRPTRASRDPRAATVTRARARRDPAPRDAGPSRGATFAASLAASLITLHGANPVALADAETASEPASVSPAASAISAASFVDPDAAPAPSVALDARPSTSSRPTSARAPLPSDPTSTPSEPGEVILDYGRVFAPERADALRATIADLEARTGWRVRVVTGYGPTSTSMPAPNDLYRYWRADRKTVILAADAFNGNVLEFYDDSQALKNIIPKNVFQEIRGRYGNKYFVDEEGVEAATTRAAETVVDCLDRGGCAFVPGLSRQQREFSLVAVTSGGFLFGAASRGGVSAWSWVFASIWVPWVLMFGFYPLYVRQPEDLTPLWQNALVFFACVAATRAGVGVFGSEEGETPTPARRESESGGGEGPR